MRQREDDVEVGHGQQLGRTRGQPSGACVAPALGAVPVPARSIGDGLLPAAGRPSAMTTERRRAATDDGVHHLAVLGCKMRSVPLEEAAAGSTEDIGHPKGGPGHTATRLLECFASLDADGGRASSGLATGRRCRRDRCRHRGMDQLGMSEQYLDRAEIGAGLEQMRGITVPERVRRDPPARSADSWFSRLMLSTGTPIRFGRPQNAQQVFRKARGFG